MPVLDAAIYWELRAKMADHASLEARVREAIAKSEAGLQDIAVRAGLDPTGIYNMDDATLTVSPVGLKS